MLEGQVDAWILASYLNVNSLVPKPLLDRGSTLDSLRIERRGRHGFSVGR